MRLCAQEVLLFVLAHSMPVVQTLWMCAAAWLAHSVRFQVAARGDTSTAAALLGKYLELYANDAAAWEELAALYLKVRR